MDLKYDISKTLLVDGFVYRYSFDVNQKSGYKSAIESGRLPKSKLVYVILHDPLDKTKVIKEGFIIRRRWRKFRRLNIKLNYKGIIYTLSEFTPFTEYLTSKHACYDYRLCI